MQRILVLLLFALVFAPARTARRTSGSCSGEPDLGRYVYWNRVTWHLKELNRFQKVVVHTIAYSDNKWSRDQLEKISEATGGEFRWFE